MNITQEGEEQAKIRKEHPDLIYIPEQDIYKIKGKNQWYPNIELYEHDRAIMKKISDDAINKIIWKRN